MNDEEILQGKCTTWFWNTYPEHRRMLVCIDNNSVNAIVGSRKKAMGVVKGPSDVIFISFGEVYFIEFKVWGRGQKPEQKDFQAKVEARGHCYIVLENFEDFKTFICDIIGR